MSFSSTKKGVHIAGSTNPVMAFIKGSATSCLKILTQHPQVEGLIFFSKGRATVAYFPRIVLDMNENGTMSSVLAAVVGSPENNY